MDYASRPERPVKVYRRVWEGGDEYLLKFFVYLDDQPGSLAAFASMIASCGGNVCVFHYDRSIHSNRVVAEVSVESEAGADRLYEGLLECGICSALPRPVIDDIAITRPESVLEIRVRLKHEVGELAGFANVLKDHGANVIFMLYDENIDPGYADVALAGPSPDEIDRLLVGINERGYNYRVVYRGSSEKEVEGIIGLKSVEKFFIRLSRLLPDGDVQGIKDMVDSSRGLYGDLVNFYSEAGGDLEVADVFEKVLTLASMSRSRTGGRFRAYEMPPLTLPEGAVIHGFRMPTSENVFVIEHGEELTMIDSGYGVYYGDLKALMRGKGLEPARVKRIFLTHADADHAGASGYFQEEFGSQVYMHPDSAAVIESDNRAYGAGGPLENLNKYYTRLINRFTECRFPESTTHLRHMSLGILGGFHIIDSFTAGPLEFMALESRGGHIRGLVFFVERNFGLFFPSDYIFNIKSMSEEEKAALSVYKYLLINPNRKFDVYREEVALLRELISETDTALKDRGDRAVIFPGHGDWFSPE